MAQWLNFLLRPFRLINGAIDFATTLLFLHFIVLWRIALMPLALLSLPIRALAALHRQRLMEMQVQRLKKALEASLWDRKDLKEQLDRALHRRKTAEMMLVELDAEHDEAILQIELLLQQIEELKEEIERLKRLSTAPQLPGDNDKEPRRNTAGDTISGDGAVARHRAEALSRSLFSLTLWLGVGAVMWQSQEPCIPLMAALFSVVAMSLMSAVRFFSAFEHKPALDAAVLLSFNWFLVGTLAYPMLPRIVWFVALRVRECT
ncbi:uncharacterized protein LOC127255745 [Andrographis paniculata]|uniref:uncharacterized protein LOC127255745 n=1 Tax=Andrographis paniculata TaxID=175694 RepID=UPI0021E707D6|nr:uncharacterized protein LOC127255745 [Andrographis paniculata]